MDSALADFVWRVAEGGYELVQSGLLTARNRGEAATPVRTYHPLRERTGLFRTLAETKATPQDVVSFADRFGLLGFSADRGARRLGAHAVSRAERLDEWQLEIRKLRALVTLWDLIKARDTRGLAQYVSWQAGSVRSSKERSVVVRGDTSGLGPISMIEGGVLRRGDVMEPAREYLRLRVNEGLNEGNTAQLDRKPDASGLRLTYSPENLIGAIWLQFALAISEPKEFRNCRTCGRPFEVSREPTTGRRADAVFCSDACKSRDYRNRKQEAHRFALRGVPVRDIASRVGAPVGTVRRWLDARGTNEASPGSTGSRRSPVRSRSET